MKVTVSSGGRDDCKKLSSQPQRGRKERNAVVVRRTRRKERNGERSSFRLPTQYKSDPLRAREKRASRHLPPSEKGKRSELGGEKKKTPLLSVTKSSPVALLDYADFRKDRCGLLPGCEDGHSIQCNRGSLDKGKRG